MLNILDKYILKKFFTALVGTVFSFTVIVFVVDFVERGWRIMERYDVSVKVISLYYINYLPFYIILAFPVAMLVSTLFSTGSLAKNHELDVMKASGLSLYRIISPLLIAAFLISIGVMFFAEFVLTATERRKDEIQTYLIEKRPPVSKMTRNDIKVPGENGWIIISDLYNIGEQTASGVKIHRIIDNRILETYTAQKLAHTNSGWILIKGTGQVFSPDPSAPPVRFVKFDTLAAPFLTQTPDMLAEIPVPPRQVNYFELVKRIKQKKQLGEEVYKDQVELYLKFTFPLANFILVLIGAPLAANPRRSGPAVGFGISIIISFIFFVLIRIGQSFGNAGKLQPFLAASIGDIVFLLVGFAMMYKSRK
jgi:lipopolysaccharide export system permease protein